MLTGRPAGNGCRLEAMRKSEPTFAFVSSDTEDARSAAARLAAIYGQHSVAEADVVVALGGDGFLLQTLRETMGTAKRVYGMNRGTVGFLMNEFREQGLPRADRGGDRRDHPAARDAHGHRRPARRRRRSPSTRCRCSGSPTRPPRLRITVDGKVRLDELICDGVMVATPAGSTAYNLSAHGPILPLDAPLLALTPISPFRPRRWRGALLSNRSVVRFETLEPDKRPVNAVADHKEIKSVVSVTVRESPHGDGDAPVRRQPFLERAHSRRAVPLLGAR